MEEPENILLKSIRFDIREIDKELITVKKFIEKTELWLQAIENATNNYEKTISNEKRTK